MTRQAATGPADGPEPLVRVPSQTFDDPAWLRDVERGTRAPEPRARRVWFGQLTALLLGTELRYVCLGKREILRRVYVAVRDPAWGTIPPRSEQVDVRQDPDGFELSADLEHLDGLLDFAWSARVAGSPSVLAFSMAGVCRTDFAYNRIGLCVLLPPAEFAGAAYVATGPAGTVGGTLPDLVGPQLIVGDQILPLFPAFDRLELRLRGDIEIVLDLAGDLFEMEDQRNWTDASFKIYSTPLARPRPQVARRGDRLDQALTLRVRQT
ncbi:MAG: hypothetical protein M0Z49_08555 [Chloroflexi bacterium]|nr:hypothetical protein [Chloroflexota bacterium]